MLHMSTSVSKKIERFCSVCKKSVFLSEIDIFLNKKVYCSVDCKREDIFSIEDYFWLRVDKGEDKECWPWLGSINSKGNGQLTYNEKVYTAHRLAFLLSYPEENIEENKNKSIIHKYFCENILCCNPKHLCWNDNKSNFEDYFWTQVDVKETNDDCWEWKKSKNNKNYGQISYKKKIQRAHRLAYFFMHPEDNTEEKQKLFVLHTCDNPPCCNPFHLKLGTTQENTKDMVDKDRQAKGEEVGNSKLTEEQVKVILSWQGRLSAKDLAGMFKVGKRQILTIWRGDQWKHLSHTKDNIIIRNCEECNEPFELIQQAENYITCCSHECLLLNRQKNVVVRQCLTCNKNFSTTKYAIENGKGQYCSFECRKTLVEKICVKCGKIFEVKNYRKDDAKYCSNECRFAGASVPISERVVKSCLQCKKTFSVTEYIDENNNGKFCSRNCFALYRTNKIAKECLICKTIFYVTPSQAQHRPCETCSRECKAKLNTQRNRVYKKCLTCGKEFMAIKAFNDDKYCSNDCYKINRKISSKNSI